MRIVGGERRGLTLRAPAGNGTRPTADRTRQALFDMLLHASWGGRALLDGAHVLDAFAGTGALGLEALSRGAGMVTFFEKDGAARAAIAANIAAARYESRTSLLRADATRPPGRPASRPPCTLVFLDPPYGRGLVPAALSALAATGWISPGALVVAETEVGADGESAPPGALPPLQISDVHATAHATGVHPSPLAVRRFGAACVTIFRHA